MVVAERLGRLLDAEDDLVVLDLAHDTDQAIRSAAVHQPAVLVLDAHLTTGGLAETLAAARAAAPATRLLVLSDDAGSRPGNRRSWWPTNRRRAMTGASSCGCGP